MNSSIRSTVLTVFCLLFLMQATLTAQKPGEKQKDSSKKAGIVFPEVEGWEKGDITTYPTAELGYSLPYRSDEGGTVTIYVYNGGNKTISSDLDNQVIKKEMDRSKAEIHKFGELGYYDNIKEGKTDTVVLGGTSGKTKSLRSLFNFSIRGTDVTSEIYLFSHRNNFIKIRATRLLEVAGAKNEAFLSLLAEIDTMFSN